MQNNIILSQSQAANVLEVSENALSALAFSGQIPHLQMKNPLGGAPQLCFNSSELINWFNADPNIKTNTLTQITCLKNKLQKRHPTTYTMLKNYDKQFTPTVRRPKGYSLSKVPNKKLGFVYHVRYIDKGKLVPTRWSTHTNNLEIAEKFAIEKRELLLTEYYQGREGKKQPNKLFSILKNYYVKGSQYHKYNQRRGRNLTDNTLRQYHNSIQAHFIPFLKYKRIAAIEDIDTPFMVKFQDYCMDKGLKPQSVNRYVLFVSQVFDYLVQKNYIKRNPCEGIIPLRVNEESYTVRNCYHIKEMKGIFNKRWDDELSYLLCLTIYSTGMRNSEIDRIRIKDIIRISNCWFINIPKSKSKFGVRLVPVHNFLYTKLMRYSAKMRKNKDDLLFCQENGKPLPRQNYSNANVKLGFFTRQEKKCLDWDGIKKKLKKENITFYSGRHFYKTLMNAGDLGDVEEYFMGHKVTNDISKRYNHRDKQGIGRIVQKAHAVYRILDNNLFIKKS